MSQNNIEYCTTHAAYIYDRGGMQRLGQLTQITQVQWGRQRDDISFATVTVQFPDAECQQLLSDVRSSRHELVIFNGDERVWEGPISLFNMTADGAVIEARDVMHYLFFTACRAGRRSYPSETVIERAYGIMLAELDRKEALYPPINVLPHVRRFVSAGDARTAKYTKRFETTVYDDIDAMAMRSGLDYTVIGRSILLFDTHTVWATTPPVTQDDFLSEITITEYGMQTATHAYATSFEGLWGMGVGSVNDPYYGEWEIIDGAYNEEGTEAPTKAALVSQATRNLAGKMPPALVVRVPQNATLSPSSSLRIADLVPGIRIPLKAIGLSREVDQMQKLNNMRVTEKGGNTTIQVTMGPASATDEVGEEA